MKKILITFVALFFLSTVVHAVELKQKNQTELKISVIEKTSIQIDFVFTNHQKENFVDKSFKVPVLYEPERKGKVKLSYNEEEKVPFNSRSEEKPLNIHKLEFDRIQ